MKLKTIRRYASANEAYIDASLLRAHGVDCSVDGATLSNILPYLPQVVELVVRDTDEQLALEILNYQPSVEGEEE
ncbi:MAG: hypothetical protein R3Y19_06450 [Rikenellaceae bacterium]